MKKLLIFFIILLGFQASLSNNRVSAVNKILPAKRDPNTMPITPTDSSGFFQSMMTSLDSSLPAVYEVGMNVITIIFIVAVIGYAMALLFKNGQWMKWSAGIMLSSLVVILLLRGGPILFYSTTVMGVPTLIKDIMSFLTATGVFIAVGMLLTSLLFRFNYKLLRHPDYHRWSRRLLVGSILVATLSTVIPVVFMAT